MRNLALVALLVFCASLLPIPHASLQAATSGDLIRCPDFSSVYYLATDGQRYVFPNDKIYFSWYKNFDDVEMVTCEALASYGLGGNVTYQAGTRLVKIPSIPTVYAVEPNGVLRAIPNETHARNLYGDAWAARVDDVSEAFFPAYEIDGALEENEIPEGTILQVLDGRYYRVESSQEALLIDNFLDAGFGEVLPSFALSFETVTANLGTFLKTIEDDDDELAETFATVIIAGDPNVTGDYLMAFHACSEATADCSTPENHEVYLAQSDDGEDWTVVPDWEPYEGSVPDVIRRDDILYIYTANNMVVRYDLETNEQETGEPVTVEGLSDGFVDPALFMDDDGNLVLFFLYGTIGSEPATCAAGETTCTKYFGSATEVAGSDGEKFVLDAGYRITVTLPTSGGHISAADPDIFYDGTRYVMYVSYGQSVSVWTSEELRGAYEESATLLSSGTGGIPSGYYNSASGKYWTYAHTASSSGYSVIRRAVHSSLFATLGESSWVTIISGTSIGLGSTYKVESPGFAVNEP